MDVDLAQLAQLAVGGIPVAIFVFVLVEALKWAGLLRTENEIRLAVIIIAVVGAGVWAAITLFPAIGPYAQVFFTAIVGAAASTLLYSAWKRIT